MKTHNVVSLFTQRIDQLFKNGISSSVLNGYDVYRGLKLNEAMYDDEQEENKDDKQEDENKSNVNVVEDLKKENRKLMKEVEKLKLQLFNQNFSDDSCKKKTVSVSRKQCKNHKKEDIEVDDILNNISDDDEETQKKTKKPKGKNKIRKNKESEMTNKLEEMERFEMNDEDEALIAEI